MTLQSTLWQFLLWLYTRSRWRASRIHIFLNFIVARWKLQFRSFLLHQASFLASKFGGGGVCSQSAVGNKVIKTFELYIFWSAIYLPLAVVNYMNLNVPILRAVLLYIKGLVFIGEHYNSYPLWFLLASFYSFLVVLALLKMNFSKRAILLCGATVGGLGAILDYILNKFSDSLFAKGYVQIMGSTRFFYAFLFIAIGIYLSDYINSIDKRLCGVILSFGFCGMLIFDGYVHQAFLIVVSIALFACVENVRCAKKAIQSESIEKRIRVISIAVYFIHMWVWSICYSFEYGIKTYGMRMFLVTIIISTILGDLYYRLTLRKMK